MKNRIIIGGFFILFISACSGGGSSSIGTSTGATPTTTPSTPSTPTSCTPSTKLKQLAIYYGWPSSLNSASNGWNNDNVATDLSQYETVVLGAGLEDSGHGDHANTVSIISKISTSTQIFGYVDIGKTNNYSIGQLQTKIDNWSAMSGLDGIFLDEFGFDYAATGVTDAQYRSRQKTIVDYVHAKGLKVFLNAFDPDDVFTKESSNPLTISSGDKYLYESYWLSWSTRETYSAYRAKVAKLKTAMTNYSGLQVYGISTKNNSTLSQSTIDSYVGTLAMAALSDGFTGVGWSEYNFSAATAVMPKQTLPSQATSLFCLNGSVTSNTSAESLTLSTSFGSLVINYNSSGSPTYTLTP